MFPLLNLSDLWRITSLQIETQHRQQVYPRTSCEFDIEEFEFLRCDSAEHWYCILRTDVPNEIVSKQDTMTEKRSTSQIQQAELLSTEKPLSDFDLHPFHSLVSSLICTIHHNPSISACWTPRIFQGRSRALNIFKSPIHPRLKSHLWPSISKGLQIYSCTTWIGGTSCDFSSIFGASLVAEIQWLERCADVCWNPWNESFRTRPTVLPFSGFVPTESHGASIKVY